MAKIILIVGLLVLILNACQNTDSVENRLPVQSIRDNNDAYFIKDANTIISILNDSLPIEAEHVGFTGESSRSYKYFKQLVRIAADTTLLHLTYHHNPKLRIYGMWALSDKNNQLALKQIERIKLDKTNVAYRSGCQEMIVPVRDLAMAHLDSSY